MSPTRSALTLVACGLAVACFGSPALCQAIPIAPGETKTGSIGLPGQAVWYSFDANAMDSATILMSRTSGYVQPRIDLYGPDGVGISFVGGDPAAAIYSQKLILSGTCYIVCRDWEGTHTGGFTLSLIKNPGNTTSVLDPDGGAITSGETRTGNISPGDLDAFTFTADAGDTASIVVVASSGYLQPYAQVHAPDGTILAGFSGFYSPLKLTQTGTYYIVLYDDNGIDTGGYAVSLVVNPDSPNSPADPDGGSIASGETRAGHIGLGDLDAFTFTANAGDCATILATRSSGYVNPYIFVLAPDGAYVNSATGNPSPFLRSQRLPQTGTYYVMVLDDNCIDTGDYKISLIKNPGSPNSAQDPDGGPIASGETKTGHLGLGDLDAFTFAANAGDSVTVWLIASSGYCVPYYEIHAPDGSIITEAYTWVPAQKLYQTGIYYIVCLDDNGVDEGDYYVTIIKNPGAPSSPQDPDGGPIASGETKSATIGTFADMDAFTFTANAGDSATIQMVRTDGQLQPYMTLQGPDGNTVSTSWGGEYATVRGQRLGQTGTYYIVCLDGSGVRTGGYDISFIKNPGDTGSPSDPDGGPILPAETKTGSLTPGDLDAFTFSANAGDSVTILMAQTSGYFSPWIELHGPEGDVVAGSSVLMEARKLVATGTYYVMCQDYNYTGTGDYAISLIKNPGSPTSTQDPDGGPIASGETKTGHIDAGDLDAFTFQATAGAVVSINMQATSGDLQPYVALHSPNGTVVTWNWTEISRQPVRQSGTYYIVVMDAAGTKTGDYTISLDLSDQLKASKELPNGYGATLYSAIVTRAYTNYFYAENDSRTCGIRVDRAAHGLAAGMRVDISGSMATNADDERYIEAGGASQVGFGSVAPVGMSNRALGGGDWLYDPDSGAGQIGVVRGAGLNNVGLLIRTWGVVSYAGSGFFYVDDGSAADDELGHVGVRVEVEGASVPPQGRHVCVTGISSCIKVGENVHRLIKARGSGSIRLYD